MMKITSVIKDRNAECGLSRVVSAYDYLHKKDKQNLLH